MPEPRSAPADPAYLTVALRHRIGSLHLDLQFELARPWTILFGASGSGKTTILRIIAGLVTPESGRVVIRQSNATTVLLDTAAGIHLPPHLRHTPLAPQSPSLFPHLRVQQNLEYGGALDPTTNRVFGIEHLLGNRPAELSGGEAQRVSVARAAAATNPRLLLLDEPFTGLDLPLRSELVSHLLEWQRRSGVPILSVTHDITEAFQLEAEVIRLDEGRIRAQGPALEVLRADRERLLKQLNALGGTKREISNLS